jgi:succinate dehydrogenase/fumarate reductase iron-sulfur protein
MSSGQEIEQHNPSTLASGRRGSSSAGDLKVGDMVSAKIYRYDPTVDKQPWYEEHQVPYVQWMRVLDVLNYLAEEKDIELAHPWFCGTEKCGNCAVRVNGREALACWESVEPVMTIEPLKNMPIIRDLVVDREPYEAAVVSLKPWLVRKKPYTIFPEALNDLEMQKASTAMDCINCMACNSVCPVLEPGSGNHFVGPAPLVQMAQVALDPRDGLDRTKLLNEQADIFACILCNKCDDVCPVDIPIVDAVIMPLMQIARRADGTNPA